MRRASFASVKVDQVKENMRVKCRIENPVTVITAEEINFIFAAFLKK